MYVCICIPGLPRGSVVKEATCQAGDPGSIPGLGRSPGEANGNPLQCSSWETPWTESLVDSSSWGHKRVGHDLATKQQQICIPMTEPLCYIPETLYTNYTLKK